MKILIADDHEMVTDALRIVLETDGDISVDTCQDFESAAEMARDNSAYDLILLDYHMPGSNCIDNIKQLTSDKNPNIAVMSGDCDTKHVRAALDAGGRGFVPKTMSAKLLVFAIKLMAMGDIYAPAKMLARPDTPSVGENLSKREIDVAKGLVNGFTNKEIAREINLTEVTVKLYVKNLCRKLAARNRTHAALIMYRHGFEG